MPTLRNLLEESHKDLHQWVLMHQEALLLRHENNARVALMGLSEYLHAHVNFENSHILSRDDLDECRWPVRVYLKEHDKLLSLLDKNHQRFEHFCHLNGRAQRLYLIEYLDSLGSFYHVMEHHEQREEQDLFDRLPADEYIAATWQETESALIEKWRDEKERLKVWLAEN